MYSFKYYNIEGHCEAIFIELRFFLQKLFLHILFENTVWLY